MKRLGLFLFTVALAVGVAGCGGGADDGGGDPPLSDAKAITAFSFTNPAAIGIIDESAKTIAVSVPSGTGVTALVATFTTTGSRVKVSSAVQTSGTTPNNFTNPVDYQVTAEDGSTASYTVTVTAGSAGSYHLPDSDQRSCYQAIFPYVEIACAGTGQDGQYVQHPLSYTVSNDTVLDNNTGLMWQKQDSGVKYNWYRSSGTPSVDFNPESTDVCGTLTLGGHSDWRLPTKEELVSIVDYATPEPGPVISVAHFRDTKPDPYWSSTTYGPYSSYAWTIGFMSGSTENWKKEDFTHYVRCVRGNATPGPELTVNGNGTVTDNTTGLIWQQSDQGTLVWGDALSYCETLNLGGSTSWRLPSIKELSSLSDETRWEPAIDSSSFPNANAADYWSSTTYAKQRSCTATANFGNCFAWLVDFGGGQITSYYKHSAAYTRCVRGGQ